MEDQRRNTEQQWPCPMISTSDLTQKIPVERTTLHKSSKLRREWHEAQKPLPSFGKNPQKFPVVGLWCHLRMPRKNHVYRHQGDEAQASPIVHRKWAQHVGPKLAFVFFSSHLLFCHTRPPSLRPTQQILVPARKDAVAVRRKHENLC